MAQALLSTRTVEDVTIEGMLSPLGDRFGGARKPNLSSSKPALESGVAKPSSKGSVPRDLVEITGGNASSAAKGALKNAGAFFLRHGLSLAGAALAGPVGLMVGSLASGVVAALEQSGSPSSQIWKAAAKGAVVSLGLGLTAGLPGLFASSLGVAVPGALALAGTTLAGTLDFQHRRKTPDFEVKLDKLASRYHNAVSEELRKNGQPTELLGPEPKFLSLTSPQTKMAQISLAKTASVAVGLLGPATAIALAGELGREGVPAEKITALSEKQGLGTVISQKIVHGVGVEWVEGLAQSQKTSGFALYNKVFLDSELPHQGDAKGDFVLGHELSHVHHKDSSATLIQKALITSVASTQQLSGDHQEISILGELESELEKARLAESRNLELRADREGLEYALQQGHSRESVLDAAKDLFGDHSPGDITYREHPEAQTRLEAMRQTAPSLFGKEP